MFGKAQTNYGDMQPGCWYSEGELSLAVSMNITLMLWVIYKLATFHQVSCWRSNIRTILWMACEEMLLCMCHLLFINLSLKAVRFMKIAFCDSVKWGRSRQNYLLVTSYTKADGMLRQATVETRYQAKWIDR